MPCTCHSHAHQRQAEARRVNNLQLGADLIALAVRLAGPTVYVNAKAKYLTWKAFRKNPMHNVIDLKL